MAKNKKKKKINEQYGNGIAPIAASLGNQIAKNILNVENNIPTQQPETQANTTYYKKYGKLYKQELINSNVNGQKDSYTYKNTQIKKQKDIDNITNDQNIKIEDKSLTKEEAKNKWDTASKKLEDYKKQKGINLFNESKFSNDKTYQKLLKNAQQTQKEWNTATDYYGGLQLDQDLQENKNIAGTIIKGGTALASGFTRGVGGLESTARKVTGQINEDEREKYEIFDPMTEAAYKNASKPEQIAMGILQSWGQMMPQMAVGNNNAAMAIGFANYGGSAYNDAKKEGYNEKQATMFGIASGATEMLMEKLLGGFENVYGKSALGSSANTFTNKVISKFIKNEAVRKTLSGMKGEFTEEYLQEFLEPILKNIILEEDNGADFWNTMKDDWKSGIKQLASQLFNQQNLEAGFQGALSSGLLQAPQNFQLQQEANKYGMTMDQYTNAVNGTVELTDNVEKVINNVLKERIQEEYDGKASKKEKEQLRNEIIEDIKNGYISTDEIEKTLGGETYTKLEEINKQKSDIQAQIDELQQKADKNELSSLEEKQKLNDLKKQIKTIDDSEIRKQLNQEIQETIKNDISLQESYREVGRRTENYKVDLDSIQDEKQRAVYQKAMDSGVLNNSNKTHALVDMIAKISSEKGINFDFTNNEQLEKSGFGVNGRNINGYVTDSGITINLNSGKAINRIVGHELTHTFEGTTLYTELQDSLKDFLGSEWDNQLEKYKELYKGVKNANIENELTSDLIGDYLFTDENYVKNLSTKNKNLFEKIYDEIKYLYNVATAGSKEKRQLEKVKRTFDRIYNETESKVTSEDNKLSSEENVKHSISEDSQGRELSEGQQEYFKDSKARDENGSLEVVYHGSKSAGFTTFSTKDNVSFYTNNENVSQTYSGSKEKVDTKKLESLSDAKSWLKGINDSVTIEKNNGRYGSEYANKEYVLIDNDVDANEIGDELIGGFENEEQLLRGLKQQIQRVYGDTTSGGIYKGYVNIKNPLIIEGENNRWSQIPIDNIPINNVKELLKDQYYREKGKLRTSTNDIVRLAKENGNYDGVIFKNIIDEGMFDSGNNQENSSVVYATFNPNQFKAVDNTNPTIDPDIRYSLDIAPISKNLLTQAEQDELDGLRAVENSGFAELTSEEQSRMMELENRANKVLDKKAEKMLRSASYKAINTSTKIAENYLDFDARQKKEFRNQMREFSNMTRDELVNAETYNKVKDIVNQYANKEYTYFDDSVENVKKELKHTKIKVSDELKNQITDYGDFVRDSRLLLRRNSGESVDKVYKEYSEMYPGFFDENVWNEADQLEALNDFVNHDFSVTEKYKLTDEDLRVATDLIYNKLLDNSLSQQDLIETEEILDKKVQKRTRTVVREELLDKMGITPELISEGNDISAISFARTDPIRVNEKVFGWDAGQKINDATVNFTKHQEAERTRFLNKERQEIKDLGIKARSKESELVQKYGEKQYIDKNNEVHEYGDAELEKDVKDYATREKIKNAARVLRQKYDTYIDRVNSVLTEMGYDEIPKRKDYMRHFVELDDKFSRWGLPFNKESMSAEDLPTDINGLTEFNRPGKSYFASANTRTGLQTTYDAITGIDGYLEGVSNLIYHTESIQRYRALTRLIRENYGREHGFDNIDLMTDEELADRIKDIQDNKLSKYAAWLDEQANSIAGKKGALDRSVERMFGRRIYTALNTLKSQVGSNMTGFNVRSAMTNFASAIQGASKTQKLAFVKGTVSTLNNIIHDDGMIEKSDFLTRRFGSESLAMKPWQKLSAAGQVFMSGTDYFTSNQIWRSKYFENLQKGMSEQQAIKNADDFAARIMGDRSKGSTAELFNSKTLGFLSQFQLEVNNQWSSLVHDYKMDIQKGNKNALGVTFELGQLFAASYMFNTMMKSLTGSDVMIDPIDMLLKIFKPDDRDKDKSIVERAQEVLGEFINQLPFANLITGGGRIPISEAFTGVQTLGKKLMGGTDNYGNEITWGDVSDDLKESLAYWVLPTGYGQIRKTVKGLSMYDDKLPVAGSYTDSGNLRFSAEDTTFGKIKAGLFGQYSSKYAQDYIESGYKSINASKLDEMKDLDMNSTEYRNYREGLSAAGTSVEDKLDYINSLDVPYADKDIMASNVAKKDIDMKEYNKYGSYEEFNYAQKNPAKYQVMKYIGGYDTYKNYEKEINDIKADYDRNGKAITNSRKNKVIKYVNSLNLTKAQKAMLIKEQYPSFTKYDKEIASYINSQNIRYIEKASILKQLGFTAYDRQIINYIKQNYRTVEEQQEELEKLGFKVYNYNGKTYVR